MTRFIYFAKKPWTWIIVVVILVIVWYVFLRSSEADFESEIVRHTTVSEVVSGTGVVAVDEDVTLSFEVSGTVSQVAVREGELVSPGLTLASLDRIAKETDLVNAQAALRAQEARLAEMRAGSSVIQERAASTRLQVAETALESARQTLLTSDLEAYFVGNSYENDDWTFTPPTVSGSYKAIDEGEYHISLYKSSASSGYSFSYSGLESGNGEVSTSSPQALGTKGLYLQFPEDFVRGRDIDWLVEIPNTRSSSYVANRRAYEQALAVRDQAEADRALSLEGSSSEQIATQEALVAQARAVVRSAQIALSRLTIVAPFGGVVRSVSVSVGEAVLPGAPAISLISDKDYHVVLYIPEADIANVNVGDQALATFAAFPDKNFVLRVAYVSPVAEVRDGITVFKTKLYFVDESSVIKVGMSADVDISSESRDGVLAVPGRAIIRSEGRTFVRLISDDKVREQEVELGLRGSDGRVEITSGLHDGDTVITFIKDEELQRLR